MSPIRKDVVWTFVTQIVTMISAFVVTKLVSNLFSIEEFGVYNVVRRSASVLSFVMLAGMGITLPRYLAMYRSQGNSRREISLQQVAVAYVVAVTLIILVPGLLFAGKLSSLLTGGDDRLLYFLMFAYAFGLAVSSLLFAYYRGVKDFKRYAVSQIVLQLLLISGVVLANGGSVRLLFLLWAVAGVLVAVWFLVRETIKSRAVLFHHFHVVSFRHEVHTAVPYSIPRLIGDFLLFSFSAFPVVYLSNVMTMTDVAYFSVGLTITNMVTPLFSFLGVVLLPYVSGAIAAGTFAKTAKHIRQLSWLYLLLSTVLTVLFCLLMSLVIKVFFSSQYLAAQELCCYMMLSVVPHSLYLLYRNPIDAASAIPYNMLILALSFAVLVALFLQSSQLQDYAIAYVVASAVQGLLSLIAWLWLKRQLNSGSHAA